ncbi:MAG: 30S ribosomal protein S5 [Chlorobiota bacterium]|nr:30S ribosomal protein S5 [Chlorobiota bacterium]QQS65756.1 MAG: 30S ribosomal protein S5 [Chlorobiota bacterium]
MAKARNTDSNLKENTIHVGRTAKVVKGGRRFGFSAIVVVGDSNGSIGIGLGKAAEVSIAVTKATDAAKKNIVKVNVFEGKIPHEVIGKFGAGKVMLKPASPGTGVIAGGGVRAVLEAAGVQDVLTKSLGSSNPHNAVKATLKALEMLQDVSQVASRRGIETSKVLKS